MSNEQQKITTALRATLGLIRPRRKTAAEFEELLATIEKKSLPAVMAAVREQSRQSRPGRKAKGARR